MANAASTRQGMRSQWGALLVMGVSIVSLALPGRAQTAPGYQPTKEEAAELQKAADLAKKDELQDAVNILDDLMEKRPKWTAVWIMRGQILMKVQEFDLAQICFQSAVDIDPKNREGLLGVAAACLKMEDFEPAMTALDALLAAYPGDGQAAIMRARVLVADNKMEDAANYIAALLERVKGAERVSFLAALVPLQVQAGDFARAEMSATEWIAGRPALEAYISRADARRALKRFPEAIADLGEAYTLNGGRPTFALMYVSSQVQMEKGEASVAIAQLVDLLELSPHNRQVEEAISRAVKARVAQMKADPEKTDLVPRIAREGNEDNIEQWNFRELIGRERVQRTLTKIRRRLDRAEQPPYQDVMDARGEYPAYELYAAHIDVDHIFDVTKKEGALSDPQEDAAHTARDYRVAAALAAVRYARRDADGFILKSAAEGYLQWAAFEDHVREKTLTEADKWIIKGHVLEQLHDDVAALDAWSEASRLESGSYTGPSFSLSLRIKDDPERLDGVMQKWMAEVDAALAKGDIKGAEKQAQHMTNTSTTSAMAKAARGKVLRAKGESKAANDALRDAAQVDAYCADAQLLLGQDLEAAGKTQEAMLLYNLAARGRQAPEAKDSPAMVKVFAARDRLEKTRTVADLKMLYAKEANDHFAQRQWDETLAAANRMKWGFGPAQMAAYHTAGVAAERSSRPNEAIENLTKAMELNPKMPGYAILASAEAAIENWEKALHWYDVAIELKADEAYTYAERGEVYIELEKFVEARADFEKAIKLGDESSTTQLKLGECLQHLDPKAALEYYKSVADKPGKPPLFGSKEQTTLTANARIYNLQADLLKAAKK